MILNIVLLFLVFGAAKKKFSPYVAALLLGLVKAAIYALVTRTVVGPVLIGIIYGGLAAGFVFFLNRIDRRENSERPDVPTYGLAGSQTIRFKWEYIPLVVFLMLIVGGEYVLAVL